MTLREGCSPEGATIIETPAQTFDPEGKFWLDLSAIKNIGRLINDTRLSTMALGAETHSSEVPGAREQLANVLIAEADPLEAELQRALNVGFMYGSLIAERSQAASATAQAETPASSATRTLPEALEIALQQAASGLDPSSDNDNYLLFMRLRKIEVAQAHSDILAFSLATAQDHMRNEFYLNHRSGDRLTRQAISRMQSIFYAGALVGALLESEPDKLDKPVVEVMRGMEVGHESVAIRMEFEPGDDLAKTLDHALGSKLTFKYTEPQNGEPYVAVLPSGFQFGPNALALPIFIDGMEEPELMIKVPVSDIEALVVGRVNAQTDQVDRLALIAKPAEYLNEPDMDGAIVGVLKEGVCAVAYDVAHPNARLIRQLVAQFKGVQPDTINYNSGLQPVEADRSSNRLLGAIAIAAMAFVWLPDVIPATKGEPVNLWNDIGLDALIMLGTAVLVGARRLLGQRIAQSDQYYQKALDQITLHQ